MVTTFQSSDDTKNTAHKCRYFDWCTVLVNYCSDLVIVQGLTKLENKYKLRSEHLQLGTRNMNSILQNGYETFALINRQHKLFTKEKEL